MKLRAAWIFRGAFVLPYATMRLRSAAINARRRHRTWRYLMWSAASGALATLIVVWGALFASGLWSAGLWWGALIAGALIIVPSVAGLVVRHALVPFGAVRLAFYSGYCSRPGPDAEAFGLCCAAWAFAHRPRTAGEAWIARRRIARVPLGDAEVVATALIAAGRGDVATARLLLRSCELLVEDHPSVRELAGEWLAADAAERGAWDELAADSAAARWPATPLAFFLEGVALRRMRAAGAPSPLELRARWLLAPHRRVTRDLLRDADAPPPSTAPVASAHDTGAAAPASLPRAVAAHLAIPSSPEQLATAVGAWDAALADRDTHAWLARRALELDAPVGAVDRALREIAGAVTDELARIADANRLAAPVSQGPVGESLARRLRHGRLDALEQGFTRWAARRHDNALLPAIDEWREFVALRAAYTAAIGAGGGELRRLAFPHAFSTGSNMAAWLWNARNEYALSHAISRWLLSEAMAVGDTEAIELGHRNCLLTVPTRLGDIVDKGDP